MDCCIWRPPGRTGCVFRTPKLKGGGEKGKEICVRCLWRMLTRLLVIWVLGKPTSCEGTVLLENDDRRCSEILQFMSFLPNQEGIPKQAIRKESPSPDPLGPMATSLDGFHARIAIIGGWKPEI